MMIEGTRRRLTSKALIKPSKMPMQPASANATAKLPPIFLQQQHHAVLRNDGHCWKRNINSTGNQHHKQTTGENSQHGIVIGEIVQITECQKLVAAPCKANKQHHNQ